MFQFPVLPVKLSHHPAAEETEGEKKPFLINLWTWKEGILPFFGVRSSGVFSEIGWEKRGKQEEVLPPIYHERPTVITLPPTAPNSQVKFTKKKFFCGVEKWVL